jgi:hypothetical protein
MLEPDERAERIGRLHTDPATRNFAELLIGLEEDRQLALDFAQALKDRRHSDPARWRMSAGPQSVMRAATVPTYLSPSTHPEMPGTLSQSVHCQNVHPWPPQLLAGTLGFDTPQFAIQSSV